MKTTKTTPKKFAAWLYAYFTNQRRKNENMPTSFSIERGSPAINVSEVVSRLNKLGPFFKVKLTSSESGLDPQSSQSNVLNPGI